MPDSKITALTSISTSTDPANDPLVIVDVSDTSMAATGTTKKVTLNQLLGASGTATLASATITGDLTVDTNVLKVDSANNRVGVGTASPGATFSALIGSEFLHFGFGANNDNYYTVGASGTHIWRSSSTEQMRLNSTGLGVGVSPSARFHSKAGAVTQGGIIETSGANALLSFADAGTSSYTRVQIGSSGNNLAAFINSVQSMTLDASGRLLVGKTSGVNSIETVGAGVDGRGTVTGVSTVATTIYTIKQSATAAMCVVFGDNGTDGFCDIVLFLATVAPKVVSSQTLYGSPAARTYSASTTNLQLALASGTLSIRTAALSTLNT